MVHIKANNSECSYLRDFVLQWNQESVGCRLFIYLRQHGKYDQVGVARVAGYSGDQYAR